MTVLDTLRRPAYTGENRCWPCTAINLVLVAVVAVLAGIVTAPLAPIVLLGGGLLVYLRGYVVPGTPRFAPRIVDRLPFDVGPDEHVESDSIAASTDPEALIAALSAAGVLVAGEEDLRLTDDYREAFESRTTDLRALSDPALAERTAAVAAGDPDAEVHGNRILLAGDRDVWLSRTVAIAETAAAETLAEFDVAPELRAPAAEPLRTFVRTCPVCAGDVSETTLRNCCGGPGTTHRKPHRPVLACEDCSAVVFEFDVDD
ncbi:hypothetical protein GRS48_08325 [Halorubrum sp. JWXQ-INN 858]|uniref:hypothetical protein n=1 Tax=Halorubrum sp. JWXQ-INN 858 TaxID=2690782 RepID=UPI0013FAF144|nr:hypothetical protein [Halorubrum sp. JWXQ-INN 858]MWV64827.1 hypothetical protein [Halorubrum sp. JWXQ-INN 858]